jgi:ATP-dependent DNA helicase DinG
VLAAGEILGPDGPFARRVEGFAPRAAQRAMAEAVAAALRDHDTLICEAGTGTGKTFAYLVPALRSGGKVIISTGTKHLQDQLFHRDLPVVRAALQVPVTTALLKGRANYLCLHRLALTEQDGRLTSREEVAALRQVASWARRTRSGDIAEVDEVTEDSALWPQVTSTADNCLGQECARFNDCFVLKARRAAQEADVVVINHHLLLADMSLKEEGFGELLPSADAFIIDEAHQLAETASQFFGVSVSGRQLLELARDAAAERLREAADMDELADRAQAVEKAALDLRLALGGTARRGAWREAAAEPAVALQLNALLGRMRELQAMLQQAAERGKGLHNCWQRSVALAERLALFQEAPAEQQVQWFETFPRSFTLHLTPLQVGETFQAQRRRFPAAWVFTSATLAVGRDFGHFRARLGIEEGAALQWESPFDYQCNALLYMPDSLPLPAAPHYTAEVVKAALPVLRASGGRAFFLFTSHRALQEAAALLRDVVSYPLLIQGSAPRRELLHRFRQLGNAVLLGTSSFWEGVDVRGPALSVVIIDKLPFAAPGDPVLQARLDAIRRGGADPFQDYQLPQAVIALKQGVGRLIRDERDRGVLMLCDPRLTAKGYGRLFLASLPSMSHTRAAADVEAFFAAEAALRERAREGAVP